MFRLKNVSVRNKLLLLSSTLLVAVAAVGATGYRGISELTQLYGVSEQQFEAVRTVATIERAYDALRGVVLRAWIAAQRHDQPGQDEATTDLQTQAEIITDSLDALDAFPLEQDAKEALSQVRASLSLYATKAQEAAKLALSGDWNNAEKELVQFQSAFTSTGESLQELGLLVRGGTSFIKAKTEETAARATQQAVIVLSVALVLAIGLGWAIAYSIVTPLVKMTRAARLIATGEISQEVDHHAKDETGALASAFRELIAYIQGIAEAADRVSKGDLTVTIDPRSEQDVLSRNFAHMVEKLREMNGKVREGTQVLSTAIAQILSTVSQVASSTTETAAAVTQTATTLEQVKKIAHMANDKAKAVAKKSEQTASVSSSGELALSKADAGLNRIREQMESIADSVIHLGEHSQAIAAIIDAVNEVAEQSSLLAVNAAIEAANAGEVGKGFAVIARSVKALADQSKQATGQVRAILTDIQKASHVAVLVTEQGTKSVQVGVSQSIEAGESIRILSSNIAEAARAMTHIAVSSEQQLMGIDQVVGAMTSIQHASGQNAENMKRIQAATQNLLGVGASLSALLEQYQLTPNGTNAEAKSNVPGQGAIERLT
jgi:methyl-accepting chemotaxis protein